MAWKSSFEFRREMILYSIGGFITTAVNFGGYFLLRTLLEPTPSAAIAWIISVLVSYVLNALLVFKTETSGMLGHAVQLARFVFSRAFSGAIEIFGAYFFIDRLRCSELAVKIYIGISVTILNYVFCKLIVFCER